MDLFKVTEEIKTNTQAAADILNDLLQYDKIERGILQLDLDAVDVAPLIEKAHSEFKLPASLKNISLELCFGSYATEESGSHKMTNHSSSHDNDAFIVVGDAIRLTQVLRNLVSNAIKFTPDGGAVVVRVTAVDSRAGEIPESTEVLLGMNQTLRVLNRGVLQVTVEDSGAGMSPVQLSSLFNDGVQFNANALQAGQGSGLGLYIAKGIVTLHKGTLTASSRGLNQGTSFCMSLPLWRVVKGQDLSSLQCPRKLENTRRTSTSSESNQFEALERLHVLLVDDVSSNRKLLRRLLENDGHTCEEADNGREAIVKIQVAAERKESFHTVLMDYEMPILNGPEAVREIRKLGFGVCIIGVTGNVLPEDVAYFESCGANDVLPKPVKLIDLNNCWIAHGILDRC